MYHLGVQQSILRDNLLASFGNLHVMANSALVQTDIEVHSLPTFTRHAATLKEAIGRELCFPFHARY